MESLTLHFIQLDSNRETSIPDDGRFAPNTLTRSHVLPDLQLFRPSKLPFQPLGDPTPDPPTRPRRADVSRFGRVLRQRGVWEKGVRGRSRWWIRGQRSCRRLLSRKGWSSQPRSIHFNVLHPSSKIILENARITTFLRQDKQACGSKLFDPGVLRTSHSAV